MPPVVVAKLLRYTSVRAAAPPRRPMRARERDAYAVWWLVFADIHVEH